jgi:hypothetical protein
LQYRRSKLWRAGTAGVRKLSNQPLRPAGSTRQGARVALRLPDDADLAVLALPGVQRYISESRPTADLVAARGSDG